MTVDDLRDGFAVRFFKASEAELRRGILERLDAFAALEVVSTYLKALHTFSRNEQEVILLARQCLCQPRAAELLGLHATAESNRLLEQFNLRCNQILIWHDRPATPGERAGFRKAVLSLNDRRLGQLERETDSFVFEGSFGRVRTTFDLGGRTRIKFWQHVENAAGTRLTHTTISYLTMFGIVNGVFWSYSRTRSAAEDAELFAEMAGRLTGQLDVLCSS